MRRRDARPRRPAATPRTPPRWPARSWRPTCRTTRSSRPRPANASAERPSAHAARRWLVICLALALRVVGLQYGLPAVYNPDEVAIMARALSFAKGTLNPHNFLYPTFYFYVLFAWVGVYSAFVWLTRARRVARRAPAALFHRSDAASTRPDGARRCCGHGDRCRGLLGSARRLTDRRTALAAAVLPRRLAAARPRLALRQARRAGDARRSCWPTSR